MFSNPVLPDEEKSMRELSSLEVSSVSGSIGLGDAIALVEVAVKVVTAGYKVVEAADATNRAVYGDDFANELLAAGGLGA
ncbi:hypothetical protein CSC62_05130 [Pseudoxanthomonas jiangsuensis]|nr:hypothetical protein CSC62_05130 [Pseudoxanthomonas jiangsuensis]